jgi:2-amino-4-hydroxy-6-hydroxymethyldihydropteridine diphosphokinase
MSNSEEEHLVYLGLGSNIDPEIYLPKAVDCLKENIEVVAVSSAWQTPAVGSSGEDYLNAVMLVRVTCLPKELKQRVVSYIEGELDRVRTENKFADRTIDIDILISDNQVLDPEIWNYAHMAVPLAELCPDISPSPTGETIQQTAQRLSTLTNIQARPDLPLG